MGLPIGTKVGAGRWPGHLPIQPWCWGMPHKGTLLAVDDPRVWKDSMHFGPGLPSRKAVKEHVAWCQAQGLLLNEVPVLWHFDVNTDVVYWEKAEKVVPYKQDFASWQAALAESWENHRIYMQKARAA